MTAPGAAAAHAQGLPRIASINVCTDQLLLTLADPAQIVGLSPYSRNPDQSWAAAEAGRYRKLSGGAEDVLALAPDIVLAGTFSTRATREFLKQKGFHLEEFDVAESLDDAKRQILRMGGIVGHPDRARDMVARIDAAIARAKAAASLASYSVLPLSRRGWVSGSDNLTNSVLSAAGLVNATGALGFAASGFAPLEVIVMSRPDLILVGDGSTLAEDQGRAFLLHPALERLYPPNRRLVIPERLTVCGGPMLVEALDRLTAEIERVGRDGQAVGRRN